MANGAVILDVDGTLVDSNDAHAHAWVEAFGDEGIAVPFEKVRRAIGMGGDKLMPLVAGISEDSKKGQRIGSRRSEIFRTTYLPSIRPFPRVRELLEHFVNDDLRLAVASSAKEDELRPLLEIAGAAGLIAAQTSSDDAERSKPDPDILHEALERTRCSPERTIMLGDTPYDVEAALRAKIRIVGVECGGWSREDLKGALEVYASPAELLDRYERSAFARLLRDSFARTS
jgi:phosphoglycolate phosphatase-like HAD superfamily hydrolase